ncbi:MAG TPA: hypothetical protein ENK57_09715 [Polyangiaceae bacterium]|nr:hypothetical protein [Polyangiaceae bacterium]
MSDHDDVPSLTPRLPWWVARPSDDRLFIVYARAYAVATILRLTLPDAMQTSWLPATVTQSVGALVLAATGGLLGWVLCASGGLGAIAFLEDQLTQSAYLLACALAAIGCFLGPASGRGDRMGRGLPQTVRVLTVLVYLLAGFHKLNADFLNPAVSCANAGLRALATHGQRSPLLPEMVLSWPHWPKLFLAAELGLPWLVLWRPRPAVVALAAFHLPLTIIFAPSFAITMMTGWICLLGERGITAVASTLRKKWPTIVGVGLIPAIASTWTFFPARTASDPDWRVKEALLWCVFVALVAAWWQHRDVFADRDPWRGPNPARSVTGIFALAFCLHGLTPYLGLGFHRTGAMLSNLRIDRGCENHLLIPASIRLADPYIVIEEIRFAPERAVPGFEEDVETRLWSMAALWRARAHWCAKHPEPLPIAATHGGRRYDIANLCAPDGWPWSEPLLPHHRRFQVNLTARCPEACIH